MTSSEGEYGSYLDDGELTEGGRSAALRDGVLLGLECRECGQGSATAIAGCPHCGSRDLAVVDLPMEGEVYTETTINVAGEAFDTPFTIGLVSLTDTVRITARLEERVDIGTSVSFKEAVEIDDRPVPLFE